MEKEVLEKVQPILLEMAKDIARVCDENGIRYFLYRGTFLGAVRHGGFIPWDDDMDIAMTRTQYDKLCQVLKNNETYHIVGNIKKQFRAIDNNSIWVDIFICDFISEKPVAQKAKQFLLTVLDIMNRNKHTMALSNLDQYGKAKQLLFKCCYYLGKLLPTRAKAKLYEAVSRSWFVGNKTLYIRSNDQYKGRRILCPIQWMTAFSYIPFVDKELAVSKHYHSLLVSFYGENYMTPIKDDRNSQVHDIVRAEGETSL